LTHDKRKSGGAVKTIGVISDTHGLLRPKALAALQGSDLIIHAGDIGSPDVIQTLRDLAPVFAVRGNVDREAWAHRFPRTQVVDVEDVVLYVLHDVNDMTLDPAAAGFRVVISGHSHRPSVKKDGGVLYLNPGSAGRRRFRLPVTVARLVVEAGEPTAEIIELQV
jgi:putative phosphoesterase